MAATTPLTADRDPNATSTDPEPAGNAYESFWASVEQQLPASPQQQVQKEPQPALGAAYEELSDR